jgi:hypothetical protein
LEVTERTAIRGHREAGAGAHDNCQSEPPPRRFIAGADAIATTEQKIADLKAQIDANRDLSTSLAFG